MGRSCCPRVEWKVWECFEEQGRTDGRRVPLEFSFSCEPSRARVQSSLWSGDGGQEVERLRPTRGPEAGSSGRPPGRSPAGEAFSSGGSCACGTAAAREPGTSTTHRRRLRFLRPGCGARTGQLSEPAKLHGRCNSFLSGIREGCGGRPAPSSWRPSARGCHPPAQGRVAGRASSQEPRAPETFEGWGPERKPPASPVGIRLFSHRKTNGSPWVCLPFPPSMRELCGTSRPCRRLQSLLVKFASQPFLTRLLLLPAHPGYAKGSQGHSV